MRLKQIVIISKTFNLSSVKLSENCFTTISNINVWILLKSNKITLVTINAEENSDTALKKMVGLVYIIEIVT